MHGGELAGGRALQAEGGGVARHVQRVVAGELQEAVLPYLNTIVFSTVSMSKLFIIYIFVSLILYLLYMHI